MEILKKEELMLALIKKEIVYVHRAMNRASDDFEHGDRLNCDEYYSVAIFRDERTEGFLVLGYIAELVMQGDLTATREKPLRKGQIVKVALDDGSYQFGFISNIGDVHAFVSPYSDLVNGCMYKKEKLTPVELIEKP